MSRNCEGFYESIFAPLWRFLYERKRQKASPSEFFCEKEAYSCPRCMSQCPECKGEPEEDVRQP